MHIIHRILGVVALIALGAAPTVAHAQFVVDFDDVNAGAYVGNGSCEPGGCYVGLQYDYKGFTWGGFNAMNAPGYNQTYLYWNPGATTNSGYLNDMVTGPNVGFGYQPFMMGSTSGLPFTFSGAYFGTAWNDQSILVTGYGYDENFFIVPIWSHSVSVYADHPVYASFSDPAVYHLRFEASLYTTNQYGSQFTLDNMAFNGANGRVTDTSATPEPASLVLLGTGLAGLLGVVRRQRRSLTA